MKNNKIDKLFGESKITFEYQKIDSNIVNGFLYDRTGNSCFINVTCEPHHETDLSISIKSKLKENKNIENKNIITGRFIDRCLRTFICKLNIRINILIDNQNRSFIFNTIMTVLELFDIGINLCHITNDEIDISIGSYKGCLTGLEMSCKNLTVDKVVEYIHSNILKEHTKNSIKDVVFFQKRLDGRSLTDIRPIQITNNHKGDMVVFTRGNTSVLSAIDHYELTDYESILNCTYEFKKGSRRDIGHGNVIENALRYVLEIPINISSSSKVYNCNGSSSMASVCGVSIAAYNQGICSNLVSGITVGSFMTNKTSVKYCVDITAEEDMKVSGMDCKITSTVNGITSAQMDFKYLFPHDMKKVLSLALKSNKIILKQMKESCFQHKQFFQFYTIPSDRIGIMIGSNGKKIKQISHLVNGMVRITQRGICAVRAANMDLFDAFINFYTKAFQFDMKIAFIVKDHYVAKDSNIITGLGSLKLEKPFNKDIDKNTCVIGSLNSDLNIKIKKLINKDNIN